MPFTLQELAESAKERRWKEKRVPEEDIAFSRLCGVDAEDVGTFRRITRQRAALIIVRGPKLAARVFHGIFPPKPASARDQKSGTSGVGEARGKPFVSDYDLMGAWRRSGSGYQKIFMAAPGGASRGPWSVEGMALARELNCALVSPIQHGAQDDYHSPSNRGVQSGDYFAAFNAGIAKYLGSVPACEQYYRQHQLDWPYLANGRHRAGK